MTTAASPAVARVERLDAADVRDVLALAGEAGDVDGAYPLSEHVVLHVRQGGDAPAVHLMAREPDGRLVGYAHVDVTDQVEGASAELVVHPLRRRRGLGRALVTAAIAATPDGRLRLWAHGDHPSAGALALRLGFERARVLLQMRRSLLAPLPDVSLPADVSLRAFRPGADDEAWVRVNALAFADHPDQGKWTLRDLRIRMSEPWFDPAGFLLATDDATGELVGFHWTKVHGGHTDGHTHDQQPAHQHDPIGEVYVLGIAPQARGRRLGSALTVAGLRHLRSLGLDQAMLYVDESNVNAVALYTKLGFARWSTDVSYRR
jgi:mycothiol synthase